MSGWLSWSTCGRRRAAGGVSAGEGAAASVVGADMATTRSAVTSASRSSGSFAAPTFSAVWTFGAATSRVGAGLRAGALTRGARAVVLAAVLASPMPAALRQGSTFTVLTLLSWPLFTAFTSTSSEKNQLSLIVCGTTNSTRTEEAPFACSHFR